MNSLDKIIEKLKSNEDVDAVFLTGSHGTKESKSYSDIDLVVILKENKNNLYSLYRWIDGIFADIFFFDLTDLKRIGDSEKIAADNFDAIFVDWLKKASICFDKSGALTNLTSKISGTNTSKNSQKFKKGYWQRINHNHVSNKRYFESKDPLYLEALEIRLFYCVEEIICGYFALRDIPWRGEKKAVLDLKDNAPDFYDLLQKYLKTDSLELRFKHYSKMLDLVFTGEYKKWTEKDEIILKKDFLLLD